MSVTELLKAFHTQPDPEFIANVEKHLSVADEVLGLVTPGEATLLALDGIGRDVYAIFSNPALKGIGPGEKIGRAVFKGKQLTSVLKGVYRFEVKKMMEPVGSSMVKVYDEQLPHEAIWDGVGDGEEMLGDWHIRIY